jgi:hypothetical protein
MKVFVESLKEKYRLKNIAKKFMKRRRASKRECRKYGKAKSSRSVKENEVKEIRRKKMT